MISLSIDGKTIQVEEGKTILTAALENNIYIPHLCHAPDLNPAGVCRLCMVDIGRGPIISCKTPVADGMVVKTKTPHIDNIRKIVLMLLINDNDSILPGAVGLGIALGLAEEIAIENKYREMDSIAGKRDVPAGSQLVAFKGEAAHSRTPAFERFVNSTLKR